MIENIRQNLKRYYRDFFKSVGLHEVLDPYTAVEKVKEKVTHFDKEDFEYYLEQAHHWEEENQYLIDLQK